MEALVLALLMLAAVLLSSVIDQLVPKVSSPLIQIGFGLRIALSRSLVRSTFTLDPDLFLVLFIAPLLFDEAKNVDKARAVEEPPARAVAGHRPGGGHRPHHRVRRRTGSSPAIGLFAAFALGRRARAHRRRGRGIAVEGDGHRARATRASWRASRSSTTPRASWRSSSRSPPPPRARSRSLNASLGLRRAASSAASLIGLVARDTWATSSSGKRALVGARRTPRSTCCSSCSRRSSCTSWPTSMGSERHHRRGGGGPGERHIAAHHRAVHLAHEHRVVQRVARRCRSRSTASCSCSWARSSRSAMQGTWDDVSIDNGVLIGVHPAAHGSSTWRCASSGCSPWSAYHSHRSRAEGAAAGMARRRALVAGRWRWAGRRAPSPSPSCSPSRCMCLTAARRGGPFPQRDLVIFLGLRRHRGHAAVGHVHRAPAGAEEAADRRGSCAATRRPGEPGDTARRDRGARRAPDARERARPRSGACAPTTSASRASRSTQRHSEDEPNTAPAAARARVGSRTSC